MRIEPRLWMGHASCGTNLKEPCCPLLPAVAKRPQILLYTSSNVFLFAPVAKIDSASEIRGGGIERALPTPAIDCDL
ncbi:hypothetical protein GHT06_020964 [Daphnia sinensis]|uniref:Uncharacterized protein n=1 Tax=Daphnia sinensis TaxID=1820382 RepID=A0AAD5KJ49_9CRUS|nr:hypothetical protein GHT06_020964 [Daphnia sinensis]